MQLDLSELFRPLGFGDAFQYAEARFGYSRAETYQHLRVAPAVMTLPLLREAFLAGKICWSALRSLSRVGQRETEARWLQFAEKKRVREIEAEVDAALAAHRELPRGEGQSMPLIKVNLLLQYSPEELEVVRTALRKVADELRDSHGGEAMAPHQALLYLAERVLETDTASCGDRVEGESSPYTVVLQTCPRCKEASVQTPDGPAAVPAEAIERVVVEAEVVDLEDGVSSQDAVRQRVLLRDSFRCANPHCRRCAKHLHAHHIVWRCHGGETSVDNEVLVCPGCHALLHAGFLRVAVDPRGALTWTTLRRFLPAGEGGVTLSHGRFRVLNLVDTTPPKAR